jgi:DNA-binding GntR family transcriptional regulator
VEARIAEQLNVSRGPVREAFKLLRSEGLLQEEPRRGTFVVSLSAEDVREIYGLRAAIEGRAARLLAGRQDPAALAELRSLLTRSRSPQERETSRGCTARIWRSTTPSADSRATPGSTRSSPGTCRCFVRCCTSMSACRSRSPSSRRQHRPIVDAIDNGDVDAAIAHAEAHCDQAGEMIAGYLRSLPERNEEDRS